MDSRKTKGHGGYLAPSPLPKPFDNHCLTNPMIQYYCYSRFLAKIVSVNHLIIIIVFLKAIY